MLFPDQSGNAAGQPASPTPFASTAETSGADLKALRLLMVAVLFLLVVLCGSLDLYLWKHVSIINRQNLENQKRVDALVEEFRRTQGTQMIIFWQNLAVFAQSNPDVVPILQKYSGDLVPILKKYTAPAQPGGEPSAKK